jgi:integrase
MRRRSCASQRTARPSATRPNARRPDRTLFRRAAYADKLRAHRDTQLLERDFAGPAYTDRDLLFCDPLGAPIQPRGLGEHFHRHYEAAGIPAGTLHTPRHTTATLALTAGVPVHILAARLGDRPEQILSTYAHLLPKSDEVAAERVAAALATG